jgi:ornithine decarboxylase
MTTRFDAVLHDPATQTPALILDFDLIAEHYDRFLSAFPGGEVYYAMKANADAHIVQLVANRGGGLEIASHAELIRAQQAGATGDQIICSNPIKNTRFLQAMHQYGVYAMVIDSVHEVEKVAQHAPGSRVYVRLAVDNSGAILPLAGKFGVDGVLALELFELARARGLEPIGLSFHVGSQCLAPANWATAIRACGDVWREGVARGFNFTFLDIGGGFPAGSYHDPAIPTIEAIGGVVTDAVRAYIPETPGFRLILEPGRGLVGDAGVLLVQVEGKAVRANGEWIYLDAGVFNGLMETFEGFPPVVSHLDPAAALREPVSYTLAGPSCDSCDVVARNLVLPRVEIGDRLVFHDVGAYTNEYAVTFNGFPIPQVVGLNMHRIDVQALEAALA